MPDTLYPTASGTANGIGDLNASTIQTYFLEKEKNPHDNWTQGLPVWEFLLADKDVKDHGKQIEAPIEIGSQTNLTQQATGGQVKWMTSGSETLGMAAYQTMTEAFFTPVFCGASASIDILDKARNKGKAQIIDLFQQRIDYAMKLMNRFWAQAILSSATAANQPWSLYDICSASNPAIANFGRLDRSTYTYWGAQANTISSFATEGVSKLYNMFALIEKSTGDRRPKLIVSDQPTQLWYINSQDPKRIYNFDNNNGNTALDAGWKRNAIKFMGVPWVYDNYAQSAKILYVTNIMLKMYDIGNFRPLPQVQQFDAFVDGIKIPSIGNLVTGAPFRNGQTTSVAA